MSSALIVTAKMDAESFALMNEMRRRYFPPERNFLSAHITLFHHLPGNEIKRIQQDLTESAALRKKISIAFPSVRFLGRGTAINVESDELIKLRANLASLWQTYLNAQDRQKFNPHVTVQNKVEPAAAKEFYEELKSEWQPRNGAITGLELWIYQNGPWELVSEFLFER